jgi:hypothetical protein
MTKLTTEQKNQLPDSMFGLIKDQEIYNEKTGATQIKRIRMYPMPDKDHAKEAKARAAEEYNKGNLTIEEKEKIDVMADKILSEK